MIELLIIVIVLGLLAAIVMLSIGRTKQDAAQAACKNALNAVQLAVEVYNTRVGHYPDSQADVLSSDGMLKFWPSSDDYSIAYAPVGYSPGPPVVHAADFTLTIQDAAGDAIANCGACKRLDR